MIAKKVRDIDNLRGAAALYECDPPMEGHRFVIVSAVVAYYSGPETYIFPADESGRVTDWGELNGSFQGSLDPLLALENAGYSVG